MATQEKNKEDILAEAQEKISTIEHYINENKKSISLIAVAIVILVGGYWAYKNLYITPLDEEAQGKMFQAERYFEMDSLQLALNGNTEFYGFLSIIDEYSGTPTANLAHYYAGIAYLKLKEYDKAIEYLENFDSDDKIVASIALGAIGDAYSEKGELSKAVEYYKNAAYRYENQFVTPIYLMKAALVLESQNNYKEALEFYKEIQENYPNTNEGRDIEKYIARAEAYIK